MGKTINSAIDSYWKGDAGLYEQYYKPKKGFSPKSYFIRFQKDRMAKILRMLGIRKGERLIDIGCGTGHYAVAFSKLGAIVTGIDYSSQMLEIARVNLERSGARGYKLVLSDASKIDVPENSFDVACAIGIFDYLPDVDRVMQEIRRVTKKKARVLATFPSRYSPFFLFRTGIGNFFRRKLFDAPPILNTFTKKDLSVLMERHGFRIRQVGKIHLTMWIVLAEKI